MKALSQSDTPLKIHFLGTRSSDAQLVQKTLSHAFPEALVTELDHEASFNCDGSTLLILDADGLTDMQIERLLERMNESSCIIVVNGMAELRHLARHMSGRRAIITRPDLSGVGLISTIHHLMERARLQEQLKKAAHHLKELSIRDELTRLYNRHHLDEALSSEVRKANRYKRPLSLVIVAIKNFAAINDALGHAEGDRVLQKTAEAIRNTVRDVDIPARFGDNEFAIILPESLESAASVVATRIRDALSRIELPGEGELSRIKINCGICSLSEAVRTKDDLIRVSLGALIEAKRNGSSCICTSNDMESRRRILRENRQLIEQMAERLAAISRDAQSSYFRSIMKAIGEIPIVKKQLMPHSERVAFFAQRLAERACIAEKGAAPLYRAGLLHDIGKLAIDSEIITKADRLSQQEEDLMKQHPAFAIQIIGRTPFLAVELDAVMHHHERYDGAGYPDGLAGERIPIQARALAIAEAWDTMTTPQPYRPEPLSLDAALLELKKGSGSQFDPELVDKFTGLIAG